MKLSLDNGDIMAVYTYLYDEIADTKTNTTEKLNKILSSLQKQGAEIEDVKINSVQKNLGVFRSILIIYEADNVIEP